jgi:hypothetical protein
MIQSPTKQQLSQDLVTFTAGTEVRSAHEMEVTTILSAPIDSVLYPRISMEQATIFVERCMAAGVRDHLDRCEELSIQHQKISVQPPQNRRDYGEQ